MQTFTDLSLKRLSEGTHWDTHTRGLGMRVGKRSRVFIVLVKSGRRQTLGRYEPGGMTLAEARKECARIKAEATLGRIKPHRTAFEDCIREYLKECEHRLKPGTLKLYTYHLTRDYPFGRQAIADITPRQIIIQLNRCTPSMKEHAARIGRTFFQWAIRNHYLDTSPMARIRPVARGKSRDRVLSEIELSAVLRAARLIGGAYGAIVELCVRTGQRRNEIASIEWAWINEVEKTITFSPAVMKGKREHLIPVSDSVLEILRSQPRLSDKYVFPASRERRQGQPATVFAGWSKAKVKLDATLVAIAGKDVNQFVLHDCRRTLSTKWAELEIPQNLTDRYLGHIGSENPVSLVYNRFRYTEPLRQALAKWENHLATL